MGIENRVCSRTVGPRFLMIGASCARRIRLTVACYEAHVTVWFDSMSCNRHKRGTGGIQSPFPPLEKEAGCKLKSAESESQISSLSLEYSVHASLVVAKGKVDGEISGIEQHQSSNTS